MRPFSFPRKVGSPSSELTVETSSDPLYIIFIVIISGFQRLSSFGQSKANLPVLIQHMERRSERIQFGW